MFAIVALAPWAFVGFESVSHSAEEFAFSRKRTVGVLVFSLHYALVEHVNLFAFVGQFCLLSSDARDAVKAAEGPEMRRDLSFGGVGVALDF